MVPVTGNGDYKPAYNWEAPSSMDNLSTFMMDCLMIDLLEMVLFHSKPLNSQWWWNVPWSKLLQTDVAAKWSTFMVFFSHIYVNVEDNSSSFHGEVTGFFLEPLVIPPSVGFFSRKMYHLVMTFTVRHGKIHHAIQFGKPSISIRAIYTMANC